MLTGYAFIELGGVFSYSYFFTYSVLIFVIRPNFYGVFISQMGGGGLRKEWVLALRFCFGGFGLGLMSMICVFSAGGPD